MRFADTSYHGPEAVDGVGRARDDVLAAVVLVSVGAHDNDLEVVLGRGRGDNLLDEADDGFFSGRSPW